MRPISRDQLGQRRDVEIAFEAGRLRAGQLAYLLEQRPHRVDHLGAVVSMISPSGST